MDANDTNGTLKVLNDMILPFLDDDTIIPVVSNSLRIEQIFHADPELRDMMKKEPEYLDEVGTIDQQLTRQWAKQINYPMSDAHNLARVAQYRQVEKQDSELPKIEYLKLINDRLLKLADTDPGYKDKVTELRSRSQKLIFSETAQQLKFPHLFPGILPVLSRVRRGKEKSFGVGVWPDRVLSDGGSPSPKDGPLPGTKDRVPHQAFRVTCSSSSFRGSPQ